MKLAWLWSPVMRQAKETGPFWRAAACPQWITIVRIQTHTGHRRAASIHSSRSSCTSHFDCLSFSFGGREKKMPIQVRRPILFLLCMEREANYRSNKGKGENLCCCNSFDDDDYYYLGDHLKWKGEQRRQAISSSLLLIIIIHPILIIHHTGSMASVAIGFE